MTTSTAAARLERPHDGRRLAGVAEGLGRHAGIDPVWIRMTFAATAIFGGIGLIAYVVAWLTMPDEGADAAALPVGGDARWPMVAVAALGALGVLAAVDVLRHGIYDIDTELGRSSLLLTASAVAVVAVAVAARPTWRALGLGVAVVVAGAVAATAAVVGMPLQDGIGERDWTPTAAADGVYRLGIGGAELDLTQTGDRLVDASVDVGIGSLKVVVPTDAAVDVVATADVGRVDVFGRTDDGTGPRRHVRSVGDRSSRIVRLELHVGIGNVEVVRAAS